MRQVVASPAAGEPGSPRSASSQESEAGEKQGGCCACLRKGDYVPVPDTSGSESDEGDNVLRRTVRRWVPILAQPPVSRWQDLFPAWAGCPEALADPDSVISVAREVGPVIKLLRVTAVVVLASQVLFFVLAWCTCRATCTNGDSRGYAWYIWLAMIPAFALRAYAEWSALTRFLAPYCMQLFDEQRALRRARSLNPAPGDDASGEGFLAGRGRLSSGRRPLNVEPWAVANVPLPFRLWLGMFFVLVSSLQAFDMATDASFAATTVADLECEASKSEAIWEQAWKQGWSYNLVHRAPLNIIVLLVWMLALLQNLWPLLDTIRRGEISCLRPPRVRYGRQDHGEDDRACSCPCCAREVLDHEDVFEGLVNALDMASLLNLNIKLKKAFVMNRYAAYQEALHLGRRSEAADRASAMLEYMEDLGREVVARSFLTYLLDNALQASLQGSMYAINVFRGSTFKKDMQQVLSIISSINLCVVKIFEGLPYFKLAGFVREQLLRGQGEIAWSNEMRSRWRMMHVHLGAVLLINLAVVLLCGVAILRVYWAHHCQDALYNLSSFECAELPEILRGA